MNYRKQILIIISFVFLLTACERNPFDVSISDKPVKIEYVNADRILATKSIDSMEIVFPKLSKRLGDLLLYELSRDIRQRIYDSSYRAVYQFYNTSYIKDIEKAKTKLYPLLEKHQKSMNTGFRYFRHYFGDSAVPTTLLYVNKLFSQITCSDTKIAVGLENYIPSTDSVIKLIPEAQLYQWQRERMNIKYLERDVLLAWIQSKLFGELHGTFAEHLVQAGKVLYILHAMFPAEDQTYILRYSPSDYQLAEQMEDNTWRYIVNQKLLFKRDMTVITNFLNAGPKTVGLSEDAPDRLGQFIGYKMVKGFMLKNESLTLQELLTTKYNSILQSYEID